MTKILIAIALSKMSTTDIKIANNIKKEMSTFYEADAGLDAAAEIIKQNMACPNGFEDGNGDHIVGGQFYVFNLKFGRQNPRSVAHIPRESEDLNNNGALDPGEDTNGNGILDTPAADFYYPPDLSGPHTNVKVGAVISYATGSAIQMAAGYEGLGKGAAGKGFSYLFDVYSQRISADNNSTTNFMQYNWLYEPGKCVFGTD